MKIIYNYFLPFKGYAAMAFFGIILARKESKPLSVYVVNHEEIHRAQAKECRGWILFYFMYICQWLKYGYRNCPFEREAYENARNLSYIESREYRAWRKYK